MCGIAGYYCFGNKRPTHEEISKLHIANESRGGTASGLGYFDAEGNDFVVAKAPVGAGMFHSLKSINKWLETPLPNHMIMHTRMPTQGSAQNNDNNHPVHFGDWLVVHNGSIRNDDALFEHYKADRLGEVDSEAIPMTLHHAESIAQGLSFIDGAWAIAALVRPIRDISSTPGLLLARNDSPLSLLVDVRRDILFWSSVDVPLKNTFMRDPGRLAWHGLALDKRDANWHLLDLARDHYLTFSQEKGLLLSESVKLDRVAYPSSWGKQYHQPHSHVSRISHELTPEEIEQRRQLRLAHVNSPACVLVPNDRRIKNAKGQVVTVLCPRCSAHIARRWLYFLKSQCPSCHVTLTGVDN